MPTYEYECDACSHRFELLQSMTEPSVRKCPKCKKLKVRRLISGGAGFIFKGSGFYETDYKRNRSSAEQAKRSEGESPKADAAPSTTDAGAAEKSAGKSAEKPATKSEDGASSSRGSGASGKPGKGSGAAKKKQD
jgi:putative FmdB family regulatory protein